ncbi:hypothetical protein CDD80_4285 [Ophiocordyceps camponoti-rufipedis]|uniref:Uncharacterized protein n=1 Tax=Ophiocordyceps camponoti-rufipedis TaxID=2004952 RepID=A0A2C5YZE9_9HYPO|nr:hypothetical protein CDD80_4285 [Ophiocordyceps camponoti-rufipedis]
MSAGQSNPACLDLDKKFEPDPDITGTGVMIGFVATAYIVLGLVVANYIIAFDPAKDLNPEMDPAQGTDQRKPSRPNPIDAKFLAVSRSVCRPVVRFLGSAPCWAGYTVDFERVFNETILSMCDAQILAGGGILISGFLCLHQNLSAYHWRIMVFLAWFSTISHIAGFASIQAHLRSTPWKRNSRFIAMALILILLIAAIVPTRFFTWRSSTDSELHRVLSTSAAICYYDPQFLYRIKALFPAEPLAFCQSSAGSPGKFIVAMRHYLVLRPALAIIVLFYIVFDIWGSMFTEQVPWAGGPQD